MWSLSKTNPVRIRLKTAHVSAGMLIFKVYSSTFTVCRVNKSDFSVMTEGGILYEHGGNLENFLSSKLEESGLVRPKPNPSLGQNTSFLLSMTVEG